MNNEEMAVPAKPELPCEPSSIQVAQAVLNQRQEFLKNLAGIRVAVKLAKALDDKERLAKLEADAATVMDGLEAIQSIIEEEDSEVQRLVIDAIERAKETAQGGK